nr:MAG TPA: hypothetical protein [Caudoviricetes sp.]
MPDLLDNKKIPAPWCANTWGREKGYSKFVEGLLHPYYII